MISAAPVTEWSTSRPPAVLDDEAAVRFAGSLQAMRRLSPAGVVVDLSGVQRCTSSGLAALADAVQDMRASGYAVVLTGVTDRVRVLSQALGLGLSAVVPAQRP